MMNNYGEINLSTFDFVYNLLNYYYNLCMDVWILVCSSSSEGWVGLIFFNSYFIVSNEGMFIRTIADAAILLNCGYKLIYSEGGVVTVLMPTFY